MQKIFEQITRETEIFIEQRKNLVMVMSCTDDEAGLVMKVIQDVEKAETADVYLFFGDNFTELDAYVEETIEQLYLQHQFANDIAAQKELPLLSEPSAELKDLSLSPLQRLGKAMIFTRTLIPEIGQHNIIWVLFPQIISDRKSWHDLISSFSPKSGIQDGMQGLRIIFRDLPETLEFSPSLEKLTRVQFNQTSMNDEAIGNSLDQTIHDESIADEDRFGAMLQKAMIDSAHGRTEQAYDAFKYILGYYQHTNNHTLQAVTINAVGDMFQRQNKLGKAIHVYETAIEPASKSQSGMVLGNVVSNLAETEYKQGNFQQAEQYYGQSEDLASKMLYADGKIKALNQQADCAIQQNTWDRAIIYWETAADFCRDGEYQEDLKIELEKLIGAHEHLTDDKLSLYQNELQGLQHGGDV